MSTTAFWMPNQAAIAQVETYTVTVPSGVGNTYNAAINGKTLTYASVSGDTAATVVTAMLALLQQSTSIAPELTEITFAAVSSNTAQFTATANTPGTPFANQTINGVSGQGLVFTTGNGLSNGITTAHTTANASPSDVNDPQNWLRVNLSTTPPAQTRAIPQNTDDVVLANTSVPLLWNLDRLRAVQFNTYQRWQSFTGTVGLPENNPGGYSEWRATYFAFSGPTGSAPAGGLAMTLGYDDGGRGPSRERYDLGSSRYTCDVLAAGSPADAYGIRLLGYHTDNVIRANGAVSVGIAMLPGEISKLNSIIAENGATVGVGPGVTWATNIFGTASSCTAYASTLLLNAAPAALTMSTGCNLTVGTDSLTFATITAQGGCTLDWLAGGTITTLTMTVGCTLTKSNDPRSLTITNHSIDGDSCRFIDTYNGITWTNAGTVKQAVSSGPYQFTGSRTVKVT